VPTLTSKEFSTDVEASSNGLRAINSTRDSYLVTPPSVGSSGGDHSNTTSPDTLTISFTIVATLGTPLIAAVMFLGGGGDMTGRMMGLLHGPYPSPPAECICEEVRGECVRRPCGKGMIVWECVM